MRKRVLMPFEQGHLDGLCGVYAIINAIHLGLYRYNDSGDNAKRLALSRCAAEQLYGRLLDTLASDSKFVTEQIVLGIKSNQMISLLKVSGDWLWNKYQVQIIVRRPFHRSHNVPKSTFAQYIRRLQRQTHAVAIVGGQAPWAHWSVVSSMSKRGLHLFDSSGYGVVMWRKWPKGTAAYFGLLHIPSTIEISISNHLARRG